MILHLPVTSEENEKSQVHHTTMGLQSGETALIYLKMQPSHSFYSFFETLYFLLCHDSVHNVRYRFKIGFI